MMSLIGPNNRWKARLSNFATFRLDSARTVAARGASFNNASSMISYVQIQQEGCRYLQNSHHVYIDGRLHVLQ
jgi:hypothetical protein